MKKDRGAGTRVFVEVSLGYGERQFLVKINPYLEFVLPGLGRRARVQKIDCENLGGETVSMTSCPE
jgi:hypothetical protein